MVSYLDMVKEKCVFCLKVLLLAAFVGTPACWAEDGAQQQGAPQQQQPQGPTVVPQRPAGGVQIWDDRVFNLDGGTVAPETRTSVGGSTRYLDKTKEFDDNTEQRARWMKNCQSARDTNMKSYRDCMDEQKKKELGSRTNFGAREPRGGSDGLNRPATSPRGMQGIKPDASDMKPRLPEENEQSAQESSENADTD